ncbi:hypothetical protein E4T56_gene18941 [Termitomyces sp. T112]|nr:hypothetical protein E4T56_gene18941 [Termitomyces sp. T112]
MQPLPKPIPTYNIDGMPNKAGAINSMVDLILCYWNHAEHAIFTITSLGRQGMILGFTWLCKHNPKIDWTKGEHATICTCCAGPLPFANLNLLDPLPLAIPCREALYEDNWSSGRAPGKECRGEFGGIHELELLDKVVEVGDQIYATTIHLLPSVVEIQASQTTSQWLAQAFTANAALQEFWDVVPPYLHAFEDVFSKASFNSLPECKRWDHAIELLLDSTPSSCKVNPLMPREQNKLDAFLQENLDSGHIHPSKSLMASLVSFIKKKDGLLQLVQDYQVLNAMTVKNHYPLPLISKLINNLWGVQYFTKLNVWWGYNNVHIQEGDEWKAVFQINWGLFDPLIMFFRLTNSPHHLPDHDEQHLLGPHCRGCSRFIQDFSHHACPLFDLTGKDVMWSWGPPEQTAFDTLKHAMTSGPVLLFPDDNSPFWVEADSSDFATGAVLSQQSLEDRKWHPVAFYSKSLNMVEQNYEIHDKEMLAIIQSFEEWQHFLEGMQHKFKWSPYLTNFDFSLHHKPGQSMGKPDALSQRVDHGMGEEDNSNIVLLCPKLFAIQAMEGLAVEGVEVDILWDIWWGDWDGQQEGLVVQAALDAEVGAYH